MCVKVKLIGLTVKEASAIAADMEMTLRVKREDDQYFLGTCDYRADRINVEVEKGIIVKTDIG